jgi:CheY-like chemotaxis protein
MNVSPGRNGKPLSILLVEDDDGDAKAIQRAFEKTNAASLIKRAVDGIEALEILRSAPSKSQLPDPRILLVDLDMPRMNGTQFIKAVREDANLRHSIVFVLTTSKREEDKMAASDLNVAGYISKATAREDFLNLINLLNCYWHIVEIP